MIQDFRINLFSAYLCPQILGKLFSLCEHNKTHDKTYIDQIFMSLIRLTRATKNKMKISVCQYS